MQDNHTNHADRPAYANRETPPVGTLSLRYVLMLAALVLAVAAFLIYNLARFILHNDSRADYAPQFYVDLRESPLPAATETIKTTNLPPLRVAIAPVISPEQSMQIYQQLVDYLAERARRTPFYLQRQSYAETNDLVRYGQCDLALVCCYPLVRGEQDFGMQAIAAPQIRGAVTSRALVIVPKSSPAQSLSHLRGKRFASADILSYSGWLYPATWLKSRGEDPRHFFAQHIITGSHDHSIQAVISGLADGAAVHTLAYEHLLRQDATTADRLKVIAQSEPFGTPPFVIHPKLDPELKAQLENILFTMHEEAEGKEILSAMGVDRFVPADPKLYDPARAAAKVWESCP